MLNMPSVPSYAVPAVYFCPLAKEEILMNLCSIVIATFMGLPLGQTIGGLEDLATIVDRESHRASSYDRTGGNVDNVTSFAPGQTHVILDTEGPGQITHLWMTLARFPGHRTVTRDLVIRMYWDNSPVPSVEVPVGDFFAMGHAKMYQVRSVPIAVGIHRVAMNCYWPMPFYKHARVELYNNGNRSIRRIYYNLDYELGEIADNQGLFHALYKRRPHLKTQTHGLNPTGEENYVILETEGRGQYVGCVLSVDAEYGHWWGEGDEMIFIDHAEKPTIHGTGSEDYFGNAWGYREPFSYPYYGAPYYTVTQKGERVCTLYRWHIPDPVRFSEHIKVTIERFFDPHVENDYTSVAYWYQENPIKERPALPEGEANHPRPLPKITIEKPEPIPYSAKMDATELEADLLARGVKARAITAGLDEGYNRGGYLKIDTRGKPVELRVPVPRDDAQYLVSVKPVLHLVEDEIEIGFADGEMRTFHEKPGRHQGEQLYVPLGTASPEDGKLKIIVKGNEVIGLDHLVINEVSGGEPEL
jgi:hypothetical protein